MGDDEFTLENEYAEVRVSRVETHNGVRLELTSPKLGFSIRLDPLELESLTWQEKATFSAFLRTPFGPEAPPSDEPLNDG